MTRIESEFHTALIDAVTGEAVLVMPHAADDVVLDDRESVHSADLRDMAKRLAALNCEIGEDDGELPECSETRTGGIEIARTDSGRVVVGVLCRTPVMTSPSFDECAEARAELIRHMRAL